MANNDDIIIVEALYSFKGKNNDELCFNKGDIITITQREEGGWWEGTLNDKTGWFPSNYTKEHKIQDTRLSDGGPGSPVRGDSQLLSPNHSQQQQIYKLTIVKEIIESERSHLADLQNLLGTHLTELRKADILLEAEYNQLVGNLEDVCFCHAFLVKSLEEQTERSSKEQRIGGVFLSLAPQLQGVHKAYCSNHPRAVCMLEKYKDELNSFMEREGAVRPGIMVLTTALSKPFRRLDKYAGMLQEYERHLEEGHADRGDTQRSSHVYKELASSCGAIRRQKELELEVVTGRVHGWDGGESLGALGEVMRMGSVALLPDHRDRYLVLFPTTLVMLAVSPRMSAFIFEGNYPLQSIHVTKLEDGDHYKNAFEVAGPLAERIIAVCQTKEDQQQWVEVLNQQSRLARSSNFTPHKSSLSSPHVSSAHVSDWPCSSDGSLVHAPLPPPPKYLCMNCGLPYFLIGESFQGVGDGEEDNGERQQREGFHSKGSLVQYAACDCRIPSLRLIVYKSTSVSQTLSGHSNEKMYMGRPYAVLTKFFSNMYRRKVITRKLLRYLSGDIEDAAQTNTVQLRRHRTECSIQTGRSSSNDSDSDISNAKDNERASSGSSDTSESSSEGGIWVKANSEGGAAIAVSAVPKMEKVVTPIRIGSNLQKWRYQGKDLSASVSSSESVVSADGGNPYGYVRYYNPEDANLGSFKPGDTCPSEGMLTCKTYSTLCSQDSTETNRGYKSVSSDDSYYSVSASAGPFSERSKVSDAEHSFRVDIEGNKLARAKKTCSCSVKKRADDHSGKVSIGPAGWTSISNSKSLPLLMANQVASSEEGAIMESKTVHSSVLNIPAIPIVLPSVISSIDSDEFSDSTPNICNKTIYEASTSSDDIVVLGRSFAELEHLSIEFPFKTKPDVAYYVSSCSGDEMGNDGGDYYESQRKQLPVSMTVSHSEPSLCPRAPFVDRGLEKLQYSSHYVQLVCDVENPAKICRCESYSHRSSDSGLADIVHHLELCPLRSETPGIGRGSCLSHCSQSSQLSGAKSSMCESSCHIRPFTPDYSGDADSLLPTPLTTPCASNPVSYATDSFTSLYEPGSLRYSPSTHHIQCTTYSGNYREEAVFRSGLYAHWWMKASVCPKILALDKLKKDYLRFRVDKKPEVPPKPKFLKPSYHIRRGGIRGAVVKPLSKSASTQTNFTQGQSVKVHILPLSSSASTTCNTNVVEATEPPSSYSVKAKLRNVSSHLSPQCSRSVPRDPSFESQSSQVSQVTVIPLLNYQNIEMNTDSQEQLCVPNRQCLSAMRAKLKGSQESSSTSNNSCYELSSLHSFNECCSRDGNPSHLRDSSEGLDVDFHRRASSHSLCANVGDSGTFRSSVYCNLQPFQSVSMSSEMVKSDRGVASFGGVSGAEGKIDKCKPSLPPKPKNLQSWPIQRSKSLPKLPVSSISIHNKSKVSLVVSAGSSSVRV